MIIASRAIQVSLEDLSIIRKKSRLIANVMGIDEFNLGVISGELFSNIPKHSARENTAAFSLSLNRGSKEAKLDLRTLANPRKLLLSDEESNAIREGPIQVDFRKCELDTDGQRGLYLVGSLCDESGIELIQRICSENGSLYFEVSLTYPHPRLGAV